MTYLWVAIGGALGSVGRFGLNTFVTARLGEHFPWGTLLINVLGSFAIGFFATLTAANGRWTASDDMRKLFMVGVCGGFTTFSAFSIQTLDLIQKGQCLRAGGNVILSVGLCLIAVWLGYLLGSALKSTKGV